MKKLVAMSMIACMALATAGCGSKADVATTAAENTTEIKGENADAAAAASSSPWETPG